GQWQKVAIARGIFRQSNLIIFDEPTAAIDPLLENKIFALFKELTKDRTSILVSHRIGPTKMADEIIVLEKGRIVEKGTFKELMDLKGKYYELYTLQAQWYQE
ncbi:MAG TPA: ATP-binding cassette domain-containing protein, partial [Bacilli bacterium]|nr:ATP-binding cassette domain-containing protein [Bacilli bacterium]